MLTPLGAMLNDYGEAAFHVCYRSSMISILSPDDADNCARSTVQSVEQKIHIDRADWPRR